MFHYVPPGSGMFLLCSLFVPLCSIEEKNSSNRNSKGEWNTMEHTREHALTRGGTHGTHGTRSKLTLIYLQPHPLTATNHSGTPPACATSQMHTRDNHTCQQCGQPGHEVDHITPISQGGTHNLENLRVLCHQCHKKKTTQETRTGKAKKKKLLNLPQQPHPGLTN